MSSTNGNSYNLGNVVGLVRSLTPPVDKPYVIWGKVLDETQPLVVQLKIYKGSGDPALEPSWSNLMSEDQTVSINFADLEGVPDLIDSVELVDSSLVGSRQGVEVFNIPVADMLDSLGLDLSAWYNNGLTGQ